MRFLTFGSLNIDYVYSVDHIVLPGETISSNRCELFCGGKGLNQSIALAKAGAQVYHAGCVGPDGDMLLHQLQKNGVDTRFVKQTSIHTGSAIIQVDKHGQNSILLNAGANHSIDEGFVDEVLENFSAGDILLLQNEINCLPYMIHAAQERGLIIALNPSPMNEIVLKAPLQKVTYFILNEIEAEQISGTSELETMISVLRKNYPASKFVLTLGSKGALYFDQNDAFRIGIYDVPTVDTTAAGDAFLGYFMANIPHRLPDECLNIATKASTIAVTREGAANSIPTVEELEEMPTTVLSERAFLGD